MIMVDEARAVMWCVCAACVRRGFVAVRVVYLALHGHPQGTRPAVFSLLPSCRQDHGRRANLNMGSVDMGWGDALSCTIYAD